MSRFTGDSRRTVGVVLGNLRGGYSIEFWDALADYCRMLDVNLILFPGESSMRDNPYVYQHHIIYDLINKSQVDGLIILVNTLLNFSVFSQVQGLFDKVKHIPTIAMNIDLEGALSTIYTDNHAGIDSVMDHLVEAHGYRRIAFIKGIWDHMDAIHRYEAYLSSLERYGIPFDDDLVLDGDFFIDSGREAVAELLDQRQIVPEAIVACNDDMAIGAIQALQERGYHVPKDIKVVGYDNIKEIKFGTSPLSTVRQPLKEMAEEAIGLLMRHWDGQAIPRYNNIVPHFIPRATCGCQNISRTIKAEHQRSLTAMALEGSAVSPSMVDAWIESSPYRLLAGCEQYKSLLKAIVQGTIPVERALVEFVHIVYGEIITDDYIDFWQSLLIVSEKAFKAVENTRQTSILRHFFEASKNTMQELLDSEEGIGMVNDRRNEDRFNVYSMPVIGASGDLETLEKTLDEVLPKIGVRYCTIALYEDFFKGKITRHTSETPMPDTARLLMAYSNHIHKGLSEKVFNTDSVVSEECPLPEGQWALIVDALFFKEEVYGYMVYELGLRTGSLYETLRSQISNTIRSIRLLEERDKANEKLENLIETLKRTQSQLVQSEKMVALGTLVAGMAHEVNTPIGVAVSAASHLKDKSRALLLSYESGGLKKSAFEQYIKTNVESADILLSNLNKAAELIVSFKNVSADQVSEEKRHFYVKEYLWQIQTSLQPKLKKTLLSIYIDCDSQLRVYSYPGAFSQIMTNLILNTVTHGYGAKEEGKVDITITGNQNYLRLIYQDYGKGMDEEHVKRVFEPFFTTKRGQGGTGLGMNIVYNLVHDTFGGTIHCESAPYHGVRFEIDLPLLSEE